MGQMIQPDCSGLDLFSQFAGLNGRDDQM